MYVLVHIKQYLYVYILVCVYTFYKQLTGAFSLSLVPAGDCNTIPLKMHCSKDAYYLCQWAVC
jgi:hypothetical protein